MGSPWPLRSWGVQCQAPARSATHTHTSWLRQLVQPSTLLYAETHTQASFLFRIQASKVCPQPSQTAPWPSSLPQTFFFNLLRNEMSSGAGLAAWLDLGTDCLRGPSPAPSPWPVPWPPLIHLLFLLN